MSREREINDLIGAIYDAALNPQLWPETLAGIRKAVGGDVSVLFSRDSSLSMNYCEASAIDGWSPDMLAPYYEHFGSIDTRTPFVASTPTGAVYADDRQMSFAAVEKSEIYQDFFRPLGLGYGLATPLFRTGGRHGLISIHRKVCSGNFTPESISLLEKLAPHVVRSLQINRQMQRAREAALGLQVTLDHFPLAVLLVDERCCVRHMNAKAEQMLRETNSPFGVVKSVLVGNTIRSSEDMRRQIRYAFTTATDLSSNPTNLLLLQRPDGSVGASAMIVPVRNCVDLAVMSERLVAIFISDPSKSHQIDSELLIQQFGLTTAEASLAAELAAGANLAEVADVRSVSIETVRSLLKRAMAKTSTHSQGQLIAKIARSLAMLQRSIAE
jgi:DNA-binding CsgD family transcriptional regulator